MNLHEAAGGTPGASRKESWKRVRAAFEGALGLDLADRARFLDEVFVQDAELRAQVEELLRREGDQQALRPLWHMDLGALDPSAAVQGRRIGPYELERLVGHGGMGSVYLARRADEHFQKRVALKLIRRGMDTDDILRRFRNERQVLADLEHPGIARLLDGGATEDGLPYLVLEYVEGEPIDVFCDHGRLGIRTRLELFRTLCAALQHAHDHHVVHRDLKPSNILVTADGQPKLLDFGIAKVLDSGQGDDRTVTAQRFLTPEYASPEHIRGGAISAASDVFGLGVILYELLTGHRPHVAAVDTPASLARAICEEDPPPPSECVRRPVTTAGGPREPAETRDATTARLRRELLGDLDTIVLMALRKEPERRYRSAAALSEDIGRYLAGQTVHARRDTWRYRAAKFVRRNRLLVGATALVVLSLAGGLASSLAFKARSDANAILAHERALDAEANERRALAGEELAQRETDRADAEAEAARKTADDLLRLSALQRLDDLEAEADRLWPAFPENSGKYEDWLRKAGELMAELPDHERKLAELRAKSAPWTKEELARHRARHPKLAELERAQRHLEYHRKLSAALASGEPGHDPTPQEAGVDFSSLPATAKDVNDLAWELVNHDRKEWGGEAKGLVLARRALALAGDLSPSERAPIRYTLAWALCENGRFDEAMAAAEQALEEAPTTRKEEFLGYRSRLRSKIEQEIEGGVGVAAHVGKINQRIAALEAEVSTRPQWLFADAQDKWWHNQLEKLVEGLKAFSDPETGVTGSGISAEYGWGVAKRAELAGTIAKESVSGERAAARWTEAITSIADVTECPAYGGLWMTPQLGLLPLGRDPESGLWEFAHLQTGEPAERGPDGKLVLEESTGLVFVLLPGGAFTMGAQDGDPSGPNYDPHANSGEGPPHEVTLSPFFLSKFEMTQGQWLRLVGRNPSQYGPHSWRPDFNRSGAWADLVHPVERVSWDDCIEVLGRLGLELPSEAQWEYGARAGTTTVWWTGSEKMALAEAANLSDAFAKAHGGGSWATQDSDLDDGNTTHARVGSYRANAFGLHDVLGNVWEWCADGYREGFYRQGPKEDPVSDPVDCPLRVERGGGYDWAALYARSAFRYVLPPVVATSFLGARPARRISP